MTRQPKPDLLAHAILRSNIDPEVKTMPMGQSEMTRHTFQTATVATALRVERADLARWSRWRYRQQRRKAL